MEAARNNVLDDFTYESSIGVVIRHLSDRLMHKFIDKHLDDLTAVGIVQREDVYASLDYLHWPNGKYLQRREGVDTDSLLEIVGLLPLEFSPTYNLMRSLRVGYQVPPSSENRVKTRRLLDYLADKYPQYYPCLN